METHQTLPPLGANQYKMIDVSAKEPTLRRAYATGVFRASEQTIAAIREKRIPKGDALALAEIAGIQGAKRTSETLPLCHPLPLDAVKVFCQPLNDTIEIGCEVVTRSRTGVEMEALCGVSAALLCLYDLTKIIDPVLEIGDIHLVRKEGGKSGVWLNPSLAGQSMTATTPASVGSYEGIAAAVITLSDRCFKGETQDLSGPAVAHHLSSHGAHLMEQVLLPDEEASIVQVLKRMTSSHKCDLIVCTGGTGLGPRDRTPEALAQLGGRLVPGVGECLRYNGSNKTPNAWLSRGEAIVVSKTLVVLLPGSPKAAREGMEVLDIVLPHAFKMIRGEGHDHDK